MLPAAGARHVAGLGLCRYSGIGPDDAWSAYVDNLPNQPDRALCFYERPGPPPDRADPWSYPRLQILARDNPGPARPSRDVLAAIVDSLHRTRNVRWAAGTDDEVFVTECMTAVSGVVDLGRDAAGRQQHTVTFQLELITAPV